VGRFLLEQVTSKREYLLDLLAKWRSGRDGIPSEEDLAPLTPEEAEWLAIQAGYHTEFELHELVRRGCRIMAKG